MTQPTARTAHPSLVRRPACRPAKLHLKAFSSINHEAAGLRCRDDPISHSARTANK